MAPGWEMILKGHHIMMILYNHRGAGFTKGFHLFSQVFGIILGSRQNMD